MLPGANIHNQSNNRGSFASLLTSRRLMRVEVFVIALLLLYGLVYLLVFRAKLITDEHHIVNQEHKVGDPSSLAGIAGL